MALEDRLRWDALYQTRSGEPYPAPDPLLLTSVPPVPAGLSEPPRALDIAAGRGQNGLWLAEQGYAVDLMDISRVGLLHARAEMTARNLRNVNLLQVDLDVVELGTERYQIICGFRFLKRHLFPQFRRALLVGGRLIYETFNQRYAAIRPPFKPDYLLEVGELAALFSDWTILHYEEEAHITRLVALKPRSEDASP